MAALVAAIHFPEAVQDRSASGKWMARTSRAMTSLVLIDWRKHQLCGPHLAGHDTDKEGAEWNV
jgi:hypothetical protein